MNNYLIYKHTSPSGKSYIGQTNNYNKRCNKHKYNNKCTAFYNAIQKYGWDNFSHEILIDNLSLQEANIKEEFFINKYNSISPNGYNLRSGGLNNFIHDDTKRKLSEINTGKSLNKETKEKIGLAHKNKIISEETKKKMREKHIGKTISEETKLKMSLAKKGIPAKNKGKTMSNESKLKMSLAKLGKPANNKGKPMSKETKLKISINKKGKKQIIENGIKRFVSIEEYNLLNKGV